MAYKIKATQKIENAVKLSFNSTYVCPSDGYLQIVVLAGAAYFLLEFKNSDTTQTFQEVVPGNSAYNTIHCVFVKKGMAVGGFSGSTSKAEVYFRPLAYL